MPKRIIISSPLTNLITELATSSNPYTHSANNGWPFAVPYLHQQVSVSP